MLNQQDFTHYCRKWREHRRLSPLYLTLMADISQRHLSYLETGKSRPSREMINKLSDAMDIPLRERNRLYQAAGFSVQYPETPIEEHDMQPVQQALARMLEHHNPYPAVVVDRFWNVLQMNQAASAMFSLVIDSLGDNKHLLVGPNSDDKINLALLTMHPLGLRRFMLNWPDVAGLFVNRLKSEALATFDEQVFEHLMWIIDQAGQIEATSTQSRGLTPVLPVELQVGESVVKLFTVISTFGTPQDLTTDEIRVEMFYPADEATKSFLQSLTIS